MNWTRGALSVGGRLAFRVEDEGCLRESACDVDSQSWIAQTCFSGRVFGTGNAAPDTLARMRCTQRQGSAFSWFLCVDQGGHGG
jgi:hypothetical protein